ncbi:MAG: hypothetical protein LBD50_01575 [Rickettsiales bacterium]|nr:hypothetical protein [Rickettsiales bacterium]
MRKLIAIFILCLAPCVAPADSPLSGTAGNNLTAFNSGMGSINNNSWNQMTNNRTPAADFGNCNSLILRCAQPKCASGGCISMEIAYPIVSGCVMSNATCKGHGEALIQAISAQLVANSTAKANEQMASAQASATAAAAAQSEQQMQQMQMQMQEMQNQMSQQAAQSAAAVQAALEEQKQLAAAAAAESAARDEAARAAAAAAAPAQQIAAAASMGVSPDVLAREQASGQIMTQLENADVALKSLKTKMRTIFDYARCDPSGNNCTGPKRVKIFKQKANEFFEPYETVLDEVYDALIMAQSLGVDITDIYMMLNDSCNTWGKYMCAPCEGERPGVLGRSDFESTHPCTCMGTGENRSCFYDVKRNIASDGSTKVSAKQEQCQLQRMITSSEEVQQNWLEMDTGSSGGIRVACASDALDNSVLFRNRKKQAKIDIEVLERLINQDAGITIPKGQEKGWITRYCSVDDNDVPMLQTLVQKKALTTSGFGKMCVAEKDLKARAVSSAFVYNAAENIARTNCESTTAESSFKTKNDIECKYGNGNTGCGTVPTGTADTEARKKAIEICIKSEEPIVQKELIKDCTESKGVWDNGNCKCGDGELEKLTCTGHTISTVEETRFTDDENYEIKEDCENANPNYECYSFKAKGKTYWRKSELRKSTSTSSVLFLPTVATPKFNTKITGNDYYNFLN